MLNSIIDLERELKMLKKRTESEDMQGRIADQDVNRFRYIQEEMKSLLAQN